jgi:hypothetical protein
MIYDQAVKAMEQGFKVALGHWYKNREYLAMNSGVVEYHHNNEVKPYVPRVDADTNGESKGWMVVFIRNEDRRPIPEEFRN